MAGSAWFFSPLQLMLVLLSTSSFTSVCCRKGALVARMCDKITQPQLVPQLGALYESERTF
jgi:hypothetical protein